MKLKNTFKKAVAALALLCCTAAVSRAQISSPYPVVNSTGCTVAFIYEVYDASNCNVLCNGSLTVAAGSSGLITTCGGGTAVEIDLYVDWIGNSSCMPNPPFLVNPVGSCSGAPATQGINPGCGCTGSVQLAATAAGAVIN